MATRSIATVYTDQLQRTKFEVWAACSYYAVFIDMVTESDRAFCFCGWTGTPYWDGAGLAWMEWYRHVTATAVVANKVSAESERS